MAKVKTVDRDVCKMLREELNPILAKFGARYGLRAEAQNASFTSGQVTFKVSFATLTTGGDVLTKDAESFKQLAQFFGLKPTDLFKVFTHGKEEFKITGLKPRSDRFPVLGERVRDGKGFKFPADTVKLSLKS